MASPLQVRRLEADEHPLLEDFLAPRIDASMILLSNARRAGLVDQGQPMEGTYLVATESERVVGVAAHYWNGNVVLQAPRGLALLLQALGSFSQRPLRGVLGPNAQVVEALGLLGVDRRDLCVDGPEGLYVLDLAKLAVPAPLAEGQVKGRRITEQDVERQTAWRVAYSTEALGMADSAELREKCRQDVERSLANGHTWVLEEGARAVASSSFNAALSEIVQIGGVYTPPDRRGNGYGRSVVAASLLAVRDTEVQRAVLFTEDSNQPARRAYASLGFEQIGDYRVALFSRPRPLKAQ